MLREAFERGEDIHTRTAAEVLGKDPATLTRSERDVAKMVNFGIIYGISSFGLAENLEIPRDEAQAYIDTYLARFPRVQEFIARTIAQAAADGYVTTLLGRRRPIPELRASNRQTRSLGERLAVNTVMQGTAADVIKVAMIRTHDRLRAEGRSRPPRAPGARRAAARGARHRGDAASRSSCARRWSAPTRSTRRSRSRSGVGRQLGRREVVSRWPTDARVARAAGSRRRRAVRIVGLFGRYTPRSPMANRPTESTPMSTMEVPVLEDGVWITGPDGELIPDYDATFPTINEGEVVHGTVVRVDKDEVLVDIGYKSEGVIPVSELSIRRSVNPADEVSVGEEIDALVMQKEDAEGRLILSKKRARFELAWKAIEAAAESGEAVNGRVIEVVKGGLILDLGVRGFLPASLVDIRRVQDLEEFTGKELRCKVIELNRSRNNVVLSRRAVLEDERKEMRQAILDRLNPGDVVDGQISNIVDFGAFVDLDGMDGLIHISELSWSHVNHPSEVLEIGQTVKVKVLDIDRERQRISLGLKQTQSDPWQQVLEHYHEEDVVEGRVTKVVTFGAFVEILPGVEGLVHISELAQHHVENPREVVSQGDPVNVLILEIDGDRRRLSLSLKRVEEGAEPLPRADGGESVHLTPNLRLSEEAFPAGTSSADRRRRDVRRRRRGGRARADGERSRSMPTRSSWPPRPSRPRRSRSSWPRRPWSPTRSPSSWPRRPWSPRRSPRSSPRRRSRPTRPVTPKRPPSSPTRRSPPTSSRSSWRRRQSWPRRSRSSWPRRPSSPTPLRCELLEEAVVEEAVAEELAEEAVVEEAVAEELAEEAVPRSPTKTLPPRRIAAPDRGRDHGWDRCGEEHRARGVPRARGRHGVERRDRPSPPRAPISTCGRRSSRASARAILGDDGVPDRARSRRSCSTTPRRSRSSRRCCIRSSRASTSIWREQLAALDDPPRSASPRCRCSTSRAERRASTASS